MKKFRSKDGFSQGGKLRSFYKRHFWLGKRRGGGLAEGRKGLKILTVIVLAATMVLAGGYCYQNILQRVPAGISYEGGDIGGWSYYQVENLLEERAEQFRQEKWSLLISKADEVVSQEELTSENLEVQIDVLATMDQIFSQDGKVQSESLSATHFAPLNVISELAFSETREAQLAERASIIEVNSKNAEIYFDVERKEWLLEEHRIGWKYAAELVKEEGVLSAGYVNREIEIVLTAEMPEITTEEKRSLYDDLQKYLEKKVQWWVGEELIVFALSDYPDFVELGYSGNQVQILEEKVEGYINEWASVFDQAAGQVKSGPPEQTEKGYWLTAYEGKFYPGRSLDREKMLAQMLNALSSEQEEVKIELVYNLLEPEIETAGTEKMTLLSRGRSSYEEGNDLDRVHNVKLGLSKYDGVVIPQGEEFSFNQVLGWVTLNEGWKSAPAIFGGGGIRSVPGGGLCQDSTTMYRAAVWGGLEITQRKPHSLDIPYYHEYGYGLDATVYPPGDLDLKFLNDTPGPIFIHAYVDEELQGAFVELYGIDDGREVYLEQVENKEVILPREVLYTEDLPEGDREVLRQGRFGRYIEWAWQIVWPDGRAEQRKIETLYPAESSMVVLGTG